MAVRCKMKIIRIERTMGSRDTGRKYDNGLSVYEPCEMHTIVMTPTYSTDPASENRRFWDASPGGEFRLNCVNAAAVDQLILDREYYIDIVPVGR